MASTVGSSGWIEGSVANSGHTSSSKQASQWMDIGTHVNSVFLFAPDGLIQCCAIDAPGSMHDSSLADFGVCEKMSDKCKKHNAKVVADSASNTSGSPCLIESAQIDPLETAADLSSNREATSLRQLSEWECE